MPTDHAHIRRCALAAAGSVVLAAGLMACDRDTDKAGDTAQVPVDTSTQDSASVRDSGGGGDTAEGHPGDCLGIQDPDVWTECCDTLRAWCDEVYGADSSQAMICAFGKDLSGTETGCIPWGPPVPPPATLA